MSTAYLSLGSNMGDREHNLRDALDRLNAAPCRVTAVSALYESEPVGETREPVPDYLNCAVRLETQLSAWDLLAFTQEVERAGGRIPSFRWGPRTIDIDILLYDDVSIDTPELTIPHPRIAERAFALRTLADLEPGITLPGGQSVAELLAAPTVESQRLHAASGPGWYQG